MRLGLAGGPASPLAKALVLGPRATADIIAEELEHEGFEPLLEEQLGIPVAPPPDPNGLADLRNLFAKFLKVAGTPTTSYAHCVHPGTGVWADRPEFCQIAQEHGLSVVAPPVRVVTLFANQLNLLGEAERLGIPTLILSGDPLYGVREIESMLKDGPRKLPLILKSVRGGGRFGLLPLREAEDIERRLPLWLEQLRRRFGDAIVFAERYIEGARHVMLPFARFRDGRFETFAPVDASLQARCRKLVEICPADSLDFRLAGEVKEWARKLAEAAGYVGVGSFDFLIDGERAWLAGGSARLSTTYRLWGAVEGTSPVAWQLAAMENGPSSALPARKKEREWSCGVAARLHAEDPVLQLPQPGVVHEVSERREWRLPGAVAELWLCVQSGQELRSVGDDLLGVLYAGGAERKQALTVARGALDEVWIAGSLQTNQQFISELLRHPWVREGIFHASFVDEEFIPDVRPDSEMAQLLAEVCQSAASEPAPEGSRWAVGDQWAKPERPPRWVGAPVVWMRGEQRGISGLLEIPEGRRLRACAFPIGPNRWQARVGPWSLRVRRVSAEQIERRRRGTKILAALAGGRVHSILYRENSTVPAHENLVILESLGTLVPHALPVDARVLRWKVRAEELVQAGDELAEFEPEHPSIN